MSPKRSMRWPRLVFSQTRPAEPSAAAGAEVAARFRAQVLPHLDAAYGYARHLSRDGSAAEDIVQDAFLRAWKGFAGCHGSEKAWLFAIVRNCFHDWARVHRQTNARTDPFDEGLHRAGDDQAEAALLNRLDLASLRETINQLPEPFRETLILREIDDMAYREIATLTAAPIGTVMSRLARARAMLGQLLARHAGAGVAP